MLSPVLSHRVYRCKHKLVCTLCLGREHIFTASWRLLAISSSKLPERKVPVVWSVRPGYFRENGRRDVWSLIATRLWRPFLKGNFQKTELAYCPDKEIWKKVHKPLQRAGGKMDGKQKNPLSWERLNERRCSTKGHLTCALSVFYSRGMFFYVMFESAHSFSTSNFQQWRDYHYSLIYHLSLSLHALSSNPCRLSIYIQCSNKQKANTNKNNTIQYNTIQNRNNTK